MANSLGDMEVVGLSVDLSGLKTGMQQAVNQIKTSGKEMQAAMLQSVQNIEASLKRGEIEKGLKKVADAEKAAAKAAQDAANQVKRAHEEYISGIRQMGTQLKTAGIAISAIGIPIALATKSIIELGANTVESENLFEVSMKGMANSARAWSEDLRKNLGLNTYDLRKNVGTFNVMFESMGSGKQAAYDMSTGLTKLAYDMASFYNLDPEVAFEKLRSGMSGEIEPLKQLGIIVNETTTKNYALKTGIIEQGQEMTEAQKVAARYAVILEQTSTAQGDLARTMDSPVNQMRVMRENMKQVASDLGNSLLPSFVQLLQIFKNVANSLGTVAGWFGKLPTPVKTATLVFIGLTAVAGPLIIAIGAVAGALATLELSFAPFLIGAVIVAGLAAIAAIFLDIKRNADLAKQSVDKFNNIKDVTAEVKRLNKEIETQQSLINYYNSQKSTGGTGATKKEYDELNALITRRNNLLKQGKTIESSGTTTSKVNINDVPPGGGKNKDVETAEEAARRKAEIAKIYADSALQSKLNDLDIEEDAVKNQVDAEAISQEAGTFKINELEQQKYEMKRSYLEKQLQTLKDAGKFETTDYANTVAELKSLDGERTRSYLDSSSQQETQTKETLDKIKEYTDIATNDIGDSFKTALEQMESGTYQWSNIISNTWNLLKETFADVCNQMLTDWLKLQIRKRIESAISATVEAAQGKAGVAAIGASLGVVGTALISAAVQAGTVVVGVLQAIGQAILGVPGAGWVYGAEILVGAATALATINALSGKGFNLSLPSFDVGSWDVPTDQIAQVHQGETIVPKNFADKLRETGSLGGNTGGDNHYWNIQAMDVKSFAKYLDQNGGSIVKALTNQKRNFVTT
jgi:hypothetical protein